MPNILAGISLGVLGTGVLTTAIAVPLSLNSKSSTSLQTTTEPSQPSTINVSRMESPKSRDQWGEEEFKKYCYGNFLKQEGKGELVICLERSVDKESNIPLFYLRWTENGKDEFNEIADISVENYSGNSYQTITFEFKKQRGTKSLVVDKSHVGLTVLQISRSKFNELSQDRCKESKEVEGNYSLKCKYWNGNEYNATATKLG